MDRRNTLAWLHLSEWQQRGAASDRVRARDALLRDVGEREKLDPALANLDLVLFTGDVAYAGKPEDYSGAARLLFDPLLQAVGLDRDRLFVVPGNHDLDVDALTELPEEVTEPLSSPEQVRRWLGDPSGRSLLLKPFDAFSRFVTGYTYQQGPDYASTRATMVRDTGVSLLGLNSAWMCARRRESGERGLDYGLALVGKPQLDAGLPPPAVADARRLVRIALLHHPLDWLADFDRKEVEPQLYRGYHFVLHGVSPGVRAAGQPTPESVLIGAGPSYDHPADPVEAHRSGYNLVCLDFDGGRGSVFLRTWSQKEGRWAADAAAGEGGRVDFGLPKELGEPQGRGAATGLPPGAGTIGSGYPVKVEQPVRTVEAGPEELLAALPGLPQKGAEEQKRWLAALGRAAARTELPAEKRRRMVMDGLVPAVSSSYLTVRPKALAALYGLRDGDLDIEAALRAKWEAPGVDLKIVRALVNDRKAMKDARDWLEGLLPKAVDAEALLDALPGLPRQEAAEQQRWLDQAGRAAARHDVPHERRRKLVEKGLVPALLSEHEAVRRSALEWLLSLRGGDLGVEDLLRREMAGRADELDPLRELAEDKLVRTEARQLLSQAVTQVTVMARYEPPPEDGFLAVEVTDSRVTLESGGQKWYGRLHLADKGEALQEALGRAEWEPYGQHLFEALIHADPFQAGAPTTASGYDTTVGQRQGPVRVELTLVDDQAGDGGPDLYGQRWEYLKRKGDTPLAVARRTPFYRRLAGLPPGKALRVKGDRLKVLVALCLPRCLGQTGREWLDNLVRFDLADEKDIFDRALQRLRLAGLVEEYRVLGADGEEVTLDGLLGVLQDGYHVLHVVCHGLWLPDGYCLVMGRGEGRLPLVTAQELAPLAETELRLALLAACQGAQATSGCTMGAMGPQLVRAGMPAVVAMQDLLPFSTAQLFAQHFYDDLARSGRVDMALAATRLAIYVKEGAAAGTWGIPVLYTAVDLGKDENRLLEVDPHKAAALPELVPDVRGYEQTRGRQDPRIRAAQQLLEAGARAIGLPQLAGAMDPAVGATGVGPELAPRQDREALSKLARPLNLIATRPKPGAAPVVTEEDEDESGLRGFVWKRAGLRLSPALYSQIASSLNMGKHIVLIGPPGTGKTTLAQAVCQYAVEHRFAAGVAYATATADWSTFDTVGGYVPVAGGQLRFRAGSFLQAICQGKWLVVDEINRAEIDKAFGELFTVVAGQGVDCPYWVGENQVRVLPARREDGGEGVLPEPRAWVPKDVRSPYDYVVHPNWRIVGTMNVYDKSSLFAMSLAFMRRFAFIDLDLPGDAAYARLFESWIGTEDELGQPSAAADRQILVDKLRQLLALVQPGPATTARRGATLMERRSLGPAIVRDMILYVRRRYAQRVVGETMDDLAGEAFLLFAAPQLDALDRAAIRAIYEEVRDIFGRPAPILRRIEDLYPHIPAEDWPR